MCLNDDETKSFTSLPWIYYNVTLYRGVHVQNWGTQLLVCLLLHSNIHSSKTLSWPLWHNENRRAVEGIYSIHNAGHRQDTAVTRRVVTSHHQTRVRARVPAERKREKMQIPPHVMWRGYDGKSVCNSIRRALHELKHTYCGCPLSPAATHTHTHTQRIA